MKTTNENTQFCFLHMVLLFRVIYAGQYINAEVCTSFDTKMKTSLDFVRGLSWLRGKVFASHSKGPGSNPTVTQENFLL